ncbi:IS607 family transposase [Methanothermococcus sp. Ax23]|uniref:IS607 family transposase n=1 Tax=Methanothermococcus sp. Ax23 TaxID=3156486 RepID=UPI003BA1EB3E
MKEACELLGVHIKTLQKWDREGKIKCVRTIGGKRRVPESEIKQILGIKDKEQRKIIGYVRVSSNTQKDDLERQMDMIKSYARDLNWNVEILKDIGSGLNEKRKNYKKLLKMVINREVEKVIITYPDRLTRFGFETLKEFFKSYGTEIIVINKKYKTPREELVEDLITIVSHFAGKLYGMRSHKYKKLTKTIQEIVSDNNAK